MKPRGTVALCLASFGILLAGCSPPFKSGVTVNNRGAITYVSCGTYIDGVTAGDARTGRHVWSAERSAHGEEVGSLAMGRPPDGWVEQAPPRLLPRPQVWRFVISMVPKQTVVVSDALLRPGRVFRPGTDRSESVGHFHDRTCNGTLSRGQAAIVLIVVLGVSVTYAAHSAVARRRKLRSA